MDVTEGSEDRERLHALAFRDPLTGLPNRAAMFEASEPTARAANAMLMFRLRWVAGAYELSQGVRAKGGLASAEILRRMLPEFVEVARYDNVTGALIVRKPLRARNLLALAKRLIVAFMRPIVFDGEEFLFIPTIGISSAFAQAVEIHELARQAEAALREAERTDERITVYSGALEAEHNRRAVIARNLRHAIAQRALGVVYQPILSLPSRRVVAAEALMRWSCPGIGPVPPAEFVPIAEDIGAMVPLGEWILREACAQARRWQLAGHEAIRMAVNVSARQLEERTFLRRVTDACAATNVAPSLLELEITERVMMDRDGLAVRNVSALRRLGVRIAVDDFGTGYSALSYLATLPLDTLKLDRSFVRGIATDAFQQKIVASIIDLAHHRGLSVVGEGLETAEEVESLASMGCDEGQGYHFARPMPESEFPGSAGAVSARA